MDKITIKNQEDFKIIAELRWGGGTVCYNVAEPHGSTVLECTGWAALFDIDIRKAEEGTTWIAKKNGVKRNSTLTLTHHEEHGGIVWDLN